jgi:hypothetical protein
MSIDSGAGTGVAGAGAERTSLARGLINPARRKIVLRNIIRNRLVMADWMDEKRDGGWINSDKSLTLF